MVVSCWHSHSDRIHVNINKALKKQVSTHDLYSQASVITLHYPGLTTIGQDSRTVLDIAHDRFFILDKGKNEILVFDGEGAFLTSITSTEVIIDFSVYKNDILDVLTSMAITEYSTRDCSLLKTYPINDNNVILTSVAKVDDDTIGMTGFLNGRAFDCGYVIGKIGFYTVINDFFSAAEYQNCRFFHSNDSTFNFCSRSGEIEFYRGDDFVFPWYDWDFGKLSPCFTNVQKTTDRIYLAFQLDGDDYTLVYNLNDGKYQVVMQTIEGVSFPLGVFFDGCNYYCTLSSRLLEFLPSDYLDDNKVISTGDNPVLIRYSL